MKRTAILLTLCMMTSTASFGRAQVKNGVYEFTAHTDSTETFYVVNGVKVLTGSKLRADLTTRGTVTVKDNSVLYQIENIDKTFAYLSGTREHYYRQLEKTSEGLYKAANENIELSINVVNRNSIEVEIIKGYVDFFYSGDYLWRQTRSLPPEKQIFTFVRKLTAEDEKKFLPENKMNNITQQRLFGVNRYGKETIAPIYLKNGIPMISVEIIPSQMRTPIEINNNEITANNKTYSLLEAPDTINNEIFVSADFFPKVMHSPLGICFEWISGKVEVDFGSITLTEKLTNKCTLYTQVELPFYIQYEDFNVEGDITITPNNGIVLIDEDTFTPILGPVYKVWTAVSTFEGELIEPPREEYRYGKPESIRTWHFEAKEAGQFVIVFKNKEFKIIVFDNELDK